MEELISVIVPVYNIDKFLNRCIQTIAGQTYKNLEIILVDDGSDDESPRICDEWKEKDNRIKVIHKTNEGPADARNVGIKNAKANYLTFVDADDYIESDLIESLYKALIENNAQISLGGYMYEDYSGKNKLRANERYIADSEEAIKRLIRNDDIYIAVWGKLYTKEIFDGIEFPSGKINEDLAITYKLFDKADRIVHLDEAKYNYVQRNGSIMHTKFKLEQTSVADFKEELLGFVEKKYPRLVKDAEKFLVVSLNWCVIATYKKKLKKEYKFYKAKLKQYIPRFLKNKEIKLKIKIKAIFIAYLGFSRFYTRKILL